MTSGVPVSPETRAQIIAAIKAGKARNAIAREFEVSTGVVSRIASAEGLTFDRTPIAAAIEARSIDLKAQRADLALRSINTARDLFDSIYAPHEVTHWDKEGTMHREMIDRPTAGDIRNYATAIGILVDKHAVLTRFDSDDRDLPAVEVFLRGQGVPALFG